MNAQAIPDNATPHFKEWYKEFHLLFEDSFGSDEEQMEIAVSCYDGARDNLTTRAEFAKAAMQGILANLNVNPRECGNLQISELSTFFADALIAELNKKEGA
jgi:hypothetical protein